MNTIRELKQEEKYNNMLKRKNKEIKELKKGKKELDDYILELEIVINKAIRYIENKQKLNGRFGTITLNEQSQKKLLDILGSDKVE